MDEVKIEIVCDRPGCRVTRMVVPGGWVYTYNGRPVFVPAPAKAAKKGS